MTPTTCSLCGQQLTMGIAHICQKQTLTHAAVGYFKTGEVMTLHERWEELTVRIDNEIRRVKGATDMPITNPLDDVLARDCMIMAYHKVQQIMVELEKK